MELWGCSCPAFWAAALLLWSGFALETVSGLGARRQHSLRAAGEDIDSLSATERLAGVRKCLGLAPGEELQVQSSKQRFGKESFLVARPVGKAAPVGQAALHATYEALLRGSGCTSKPGSKQSWLIDTGSNDVELMAMASSLGCGVSVLDADVASARAEEMTGCLNEEPNRPVKVSRLLASNVVEQPSLAKTTSAGNTSKPHVLAVTLDSMFENPQLPGPSSAPISVLKITPPGEGAQTLRALEGAEVLLQSGRVKCLVTHMNFDMNSTEELISRFSLLEKTGYNFAHLGALDYSALDVTDKGTYPLFHTDSQQLQELFDSYRKIRNFDERAGFRVYSGSLSLDRDGHYFDYTDFIVACRKKFPKKLTVLDKGTIRFSNGKWWLEKSPASK